jgi:7-carboxy-7-deazaguanine synthase
MLVQEIMNSLQGEGMYTGYPTTFVRLMGCNLKCTYCDTIQTVNTPTMSLSVEQAFHTIRVHAGKIKHICITGGEPLCSPDAEDLAKELATYNYNVTIETNGSKKLKDYFKREYNYCMDIKCPSSGESHRNLYDNLKLLGDMDEVKFVISNWQDYLFAKEVIAKHPTQAQIIFSPVFSESGYNEGQALAEWLLEDNLEGVRLGLQIHKVLGIY